jgi:rSAM/selenodomain-associated transferase 1
MLDRLPTIAVGIICKTPAAGFCKTRLSPPLAPEDCAGLSACFIRDLANTISELAADGGVAPYAVYTPIGSEATLRTLLSRDFRLQCQVDGGFGTRLRTGLSDLLNAGHAGAILVNSDSPTLPVTILRQAVDAVREKRGVVLSPAFDGGYTLIGVSEIGNQLFENIPWSTADVYRLTVERARQIGRPVFNVPAWYDVDDAESLNILCDEFLGKPIPFGAKGMTGAAASFTREFLARHLVRKVEPAASLCE